MLKRKTMLAVAGSTLAVLGMTISGLAAPTSTITTKDGRGADALIQGGTSSAKNLGTHSLSVKNAMDINYARKSYVRFDLAGVANPLADLESATLQLTETAPTSNTPAGKEWTFHLYGLPDGDAGENWDEKTITWDNAPQNDTTSGSSALAGAVNLGTFKIKGAGNAGDMISFSSPELIAFLKADTNKLATIILTREEPDSSLADNVVHSFASKEQSKLAPPTLVLNFKAP